MYKILIVDDENAIRRGLVNFVEWTSIGCQVIGEAANGLDAIEKLKLGLPDIIITDIKMPGMNGLELAKHVHDNHLPIKTIILTGYADFSYAQTALKYGVIDFVLKPTEPEHLLDAVKKAIQQLLEENAHREKLALLETRMLVYTEDLRDRFLKEVLDGGLTEANMILKKAAEFDLIIKHYYVMVFEIDPLKESKKATNTTFSNLKKLIATVLMNYSHHILPLKDNQLCVILSNGSSTEFTELLMEVCSEILQTMENFTASPTFIGISNFHYDILELSDAYIEATAALTFRFYHQSASCITFYSNSINASGNDELVLTKTALEAILGMIKNGTQAELSCLIRDLFEKPILNQQPISNIKNMAITLCSSFETLLLNHNMSLAHCTREGVSIYKEILDSTSAFSLCGIITEAANCVSTTLRSLVKQDNLIIAKATAYINENYMHSLTLKLLADHVHTNSSYLSRLYKKKTGDTVTEAINRVRLEKAKTLLTCTDLKTYEVAEKVGIPDPSYFSILFKKYTGTSPKTYTKL